MESTVSMNNKWFENNLTIINTMNVNTASPNKIQSLSNFVSVKQEAEFLDENLICPEFNASQLNSNERSMKNKNYNNENNQSSISMNNQPAAIVSSDSEIMNCVIDDTDSDRLQENENFITERISPRCQVDVIDMRDEQFMDYKYILVYEDQTSQFVVLRPLKNNDKTHVAIELFDILSIIGAPRVLQSKNGREFAREIVRELRSVWSDVVIVHGDAVIPSPFSSSSSSSSIIKRDFKQLLNTWLIENPGKTWCEGLKFVQINENRNFRSSEYSKTPHELLFANNADDDRFKISPIAKETMKSIWREEDWQRLLRNHQDMSQKNDDTSNTKFNDTNYSEKVSSNDSASQIDEDIHIKEDGSDRQEIEFENQTRRQSSNKCDNSSGFKFVNVKNESPLNGTQIDDSQSETEENEDSKTKTRGRDKYPLKCKICQKRYMKLGHLKNHLKAHTKADGFECTICSKKFRLLTVYEKHMRRFHKSDDKTSPDIRGDVESDREDNSKLRRLNDGEIKSEDNDNSEIRKVKKVKRRITRPGSKKVFKENRATRLNGTPLLECSYCQQKFDFPSVLKRHLRSHTNERPYLCQICNKSFKQLGHLSQHSLTHTDYRSFQCATCGIKFESLDSLKIHSQSHKGDKLMYRPKEVYRLFECDNCKKVFTTKSVLERHIFTHTHERQFGCKVCGKRFKQAGHVKSHMLVHTGERKFECKICSKRFSLSNSLKKHMYIHNGEKPYQCDVCGARFLEKRNLNGHLMTHTNERPFSCNICGKRYTLADTLRRHISAAHEDGRTYQCEICAKMFKQLAHLYVHKKVHTDERPYQCHLCEKNFKHKNVLKSHLAIHANLRPFECDVCKSTFVRKTNLQTHIASAHMNERPYVCTICNKRFKQVSHLNGHVVVHSNSMPYQCDFCDRRCNRLDNLKKHMRLHTKSKE